MMHATQNTDGKTGESDICPISWCTTDPAEHAWDVDHDEWLIHRSYTIEVVDPISAQPPALVRWTSATEADGTEIEPPHLYIDIDRGSDALSMEQALELAEALQGAVRRYRAVSTS